MRRGRDQLGQATVEFTLVLPLVVLLGLVVAQLGLVTIDALLVHHAAREGARAAAVDPTPGAVRAAVGGSTSLEADRTSVVLTGGRTEGDVATVRVTHRSATDMPLVGWMIDDVEVSAVASMRVE